MVITITNTGATDVDIIEFIEKTSTVAPGASHALDADTVKFKIGDVEIEIT